MSLGSNISDIMNYFCTVVICRGQEPIPKSALVILIAVSKLYALGPYFGIILLLMKYFLVLSSQPVIRAIMIVLDVLYLQISCLSLGLYWCIYSQAVSDGKKARFKLCLTAFLIFWVLRLAYLSHWL